MSMVRARKALRQKVGYRPPITKFLQEFKLGQKVVIKQEASSRKGMPHLRYKGMVGKVVERRGKSYVVEVKNGGKKKKLLARPEHLQPA